MQYSVLCFPCSSAGKESTRNAGDLGSIPGLGRSAGEGKGYPLQYSGLENSMDYVSMGLQRVGPDWATFTSLHRAQPRPAESQYLGIGPGNLHGPQTSQLSFLDPQVCGSWAWAIGSTEVGVRGSESGNMRACVLSCFSLVQLCVTLWTMARFLCPWDSPGKNIGVGWHVLLQEISLRVQTCVCYVSCLDSQVLYHLCHLSGNIFGSNSSVMRKGKRNTKPAPGPALPLTG